MSISSMADGRIQRQRDGASTAAGANKEQALTPGKGLSDLTRYIPTEAVAAYTVLVAGIFTPLHPEGDKKLSDLDFSSRWWFLFGSAIGTAALTWLIYKGKARSANFTKSGKRDIPVFEMAVSAFALVVWASCLPDTPFADWSKYGDWWPPFILPFASGLIVICASAWGKIPPTYEVAADGDNTTVVATQP